MRKIITISLDEEEEKRMRETVKKKGFPSVSSYFKHLIAIEEDMISEEELIRDVKGSIEEYKKGDSVRADSIKDLI
jgi:Arc/MetJ-type ribon-helix-helix transcriptional regulator